MLELDQKYLNAKRAETKRLVEVESFDWPSADAKADGEAKWLRQREEEKIGLTEQMRAAESQKRHELAIQASEAEGLAPARVGVALDGARLHVVRADLRPNPHAHVRVRHVQSLCGYVLGPVDCHAEHAALTLARRTASDGRRSRRT